MRYRVESLFLQPCGYAYSFVKRCFIILCLTNSFLTNRPVFFL